MRWFRRKKDVQPKYEPTVPKNGLPQGVPPAVYRKLRQIKMAMLTGDRMLIRFNQQSLMNGGWEVPTTPQECDDIEARLREHAAKAFD